MIMSFLLVLALVRRKDLLKAPDRTVTSGRAGSSLLWGTAIVAIDVLADPERLSRLGGVAG
jgi:hypothetical protein